MVTNPYESMTREQLIGIIMTYNDTIDWHTSCINCGGLLNQLYAQDHEIYRLKKWLDAVNLEVRKAVLNELVDDMDERRMA